MVFRVVFAITAIVVGFVNADNADNAMLQSTQKKSSVETFPVTEACLECICETLDKCSAIEKCSGDTCGMFGITWAFWVDSGSPILPGTDPKDPNAYQKCTTDPTCARTSVVNYMNKFAQDCNNDGVINCLDYVSIHILGGYGCSGKLNDQFKNRFLTCQAQKQPCVNKFPVTDACLGCICETLGKCSADVKCSGDTCGMYGITKAYWVDSGSPVLPGCDPKDPNAYQNCATDNNCARTSVVNYLTRFAQDCNNDGGIDCLDYVSIHILGGYGCSGKLNDQFKNRFLTCQAKVQKPSG